MRISVNKSDIGYRSTLDVSFVKVCLDGVWLHNCITADDRLGEVVCYKYNERGQFFLNDDNELATETLKGVVEIILDSRNDA